MRVLHASPYPPTRSGIASYGEAFASALEAAGRPVEFRRFPDTAERPSTIDGLVRQVLAFHDAVRQWRPNVVHIEAAYGLLREFYILLSLPASRPYKVVVTAHDAPCLAGEPLWFLGRADATSVDSLGVLGPRLISDYSFALEKKAYRLSDAVIALTTAGVSELRRQFGDHSRVEWLPHGVSIPPACARLPRSPLRLLYFGYLHPQKGLDTLLAALSLLPQGSVTLTIAGEPYRLTREADANSELLDALMRSTAAAAFPQPVQWRGYVPDAELIELFDQHDVLVLPYKESLLRSTSGVMYRGMAHGLAIVATRARALHEFISHDISGLLVEPDSSQALAAALGRLAAEPATILRLGTAAREFVIGHHAWPLVARRMSALYESVLTSERVAAVPA